jgi:hypothetical protein
VEFQVIAELTAEHRIQAVFFFTGREDGRFRVAVSAATNVATWRRVVHKQVPYSSATRNTPRLPSLRCELGEIHLLSR